MENEYYELGQQMASKWRFDEICLNHLSMAQKNRQHTSKHEKDISR